MPFVQLSKLATRPLEWLWPGHLPIGHLVLLDGDPGNGKSLISLDLCARVTTGREFPDGAAPSPPANVLILNGEDPAEELARPRLVAARADLERVTVWTRNAGEPFLHLPGDIAELERILALCRPRLVVLDPLTAFLEPRFYLANEHDARGALRPLADLASRHRCVMLLVRHLNKDSGQRALYRGLHSIGFVAACRLAFLAGRDPRHGGRFILAQAKSNLDAPRPSLAYVIASHPSGPVIDWQGPVSAGADELVAVPTRSVRRNQATDLLRELLKAGPRPVAEIAAAARAQGISGRTLRRARHELKIEREIVGPYGQHCSWWLLPGQQLPDGVLAPEVKEACAALRTMRERNSLGEAGAA